MSAAYELFGAATHAGAQSDAQRLLTAPVDVRNELLETLLLEHRLSCSEPECSVCATLDCPAYDSMHYMAEGCPECSYHRQRRV